MFSINPRRRTLLLILLLSGPFTRLGAQTDTRPLIFGFLPSRTAVSLFKQYTPLLEYLSQQLKRHVVLETAADYPAFLLNTKNRKYDFVLTAPHFALLAIDSSKYNAPVTYTKALMADILVPRNSPITHIRQLASKMISLPAEGAIISMAGKHHMSQHGLTGSMSPQYVVTQSHNASLLAMLAGDTTAAIVSANITRQFMKQNTPIKKLATTEALPGMAFLVARDLPKQLRVSFTRTLIQMQDKRDGKVVLRKMGYPGYRKAKANEFDAARPYLNIHNGSSNTSRD